MRSRAFDAVAVETINAEELPLVLSPRRPDCNLADWVTTHRAGLDQALIESGAILFRGFAISNPSAELERFSRAVVGELLEYVYRSTPRTAVGKNVYTATEYPPRATIPQHNENAYSRDWPMKLMFCCAQPALQGGETPLARNVRVTKRISERTRATFKERGVLYVRNYGSHLDLPWSVVFQTESKVDVEQFCARHGIEFEWRPGGGLRTRQVCQGLAVHPKTKDELWFNQAHLFHVSSLDAETHEAMRMLFSDEDLPRNAYYGDGGALEPQVLAEIRAAFEENTLAFPWQKNDVLLVDNMLVSHGRKPFTGPRRVLVAMGEPFSASGGEAFPRLA